MEKYGVDKDILHLELRNEEAKLMSKIQQIHTEKLGEDYSGLETRLQQVRNKLTELDLGTSILGSN